MCETGRLGAVGRTVRLWLLTWVPWSRCRYQEQTWRQGSIHTSTVRVVNVSAAWDYAVFSCTARNSLGEDRLDIQLVSTSSCFLCVHSGRMTEVFVFQ